MKWISGVWLLLGFSLSAHAIIDMKNANFSTSWTDLIVPGGGYEMKVQRTYNSRSLINGLFGFGWCSEFETKMVISPDNTLKVFECGAGLETTYTTKDYGQKDIEKLVQNILQKVKAEGKRTEDYISGLRKNLLQDSRLRIRMALDYDLTASVKEGAIYYANGKEVENITLTKEFYVRQLADGSFQRFDFKGRLIAMYDKNSNFLKFIYDGSQLKEIADNNGRRLLLKYNNNKRLTTISGPSGITVEYKFEKLDNLAWVNNAWGNVYTYEYDELHNLTKATWPDKSTIQLSYDRNKDWVLSYKDRQNCLESYTYESSKDDPKNHYWSIVEKKCGKEIVNNTKFEFYHKVRKDGVTYLSRTTTVTNGISNEIVYHEIFGKPILIKRAGEKVTFEYLANGQLRAKNTQFTRMVYDYDSKAKKVSKVKTTFMDEKGKKTAERISEFQYDSKGNLNFAKNSDGQKINLTYDGKGRIASIEDQAKKLVKITYDEKFGKPAIVTRPSLGTIKISYKSNGDIDKAESPDGPQVAVQVASTFNNLLDVIAPATAEVFN
jgi:YD repeat-containing protein